MKQDLNLNGKCVKDYAKGLSELTTSDGKQFADVAVTLQDYAKLVLEESEDAEFIAARKAKDDALKAYNKELTRILKNDANYMKIERHAKAKAVSLLGANVLLWYNDNSNLESSAKETDTLQKIASWLCSLHNRYFASKQDAKKVSKAKQSKEEKRKSLLAALAALDNE